MFIHPPKTGGSSITHSLLDIVDEGHHGGANTHLSLWDLCPEHDGYLKVMTVRNPWDLCASWVRWHHKAGDYGKTLDIAVRRVLTPYQLGAPCMDMFIRFERFADGFAEFCERIGIDAELLHLNGTYSEDYRPLYTPTQRRIVSERWAWTIEHFGYTF